MKLSYRLYTLELRNRFTLSNSSRTTTPAVLVELEENGMIGYGEASLPPYLVENQESVIEFYNKIDINQLSTKYDIDYVVDYIHSIAPDNHAAKASIDIAIHDLYGNINGFSWCKKWGGEINNIPPTSFTIGIDSPEMIRKKTIEASSFRILKVKLGSPTDRLLIETIREVTNVPLCVDANQGWSDKHFALDMAEWCHEQGVVFIEQPMPKEQYDEAAWLTARSPIPIIADEAFQGMKDFKRAKESYSGINIKLMKCGGIREAYRIIEEARKSEVKIMLGCMTETSCAISAAAQLSPFVDWADLDGHLLIGNDCFSGAELIDGRIIPSGKHGIGVERIY